MMKSQSLPQEVLQIERPSFTSLRRVLVVGHVCLLEEGVSHLLTTRKNLEVFHADDCDPNHLLEKVEQIHPDVLVFCHVDSDVQKYLLKMLDGVSSLAELRIIVIQIQNIALQVYEHKRWFSAQQTAFFPLVFGEDTGMLLD